MTPIYNSGREEAHALKCILFFIGLLTPYKRYQKFYKAILFYGNLALTRYKIKIMQLLFNFIFNIRFSVNRTQSGNKITCLILYAMPFKIMKQHGLCLK